MQRDRSANKMETETKQINCDSFSICLCFFFSFSLCLKLKRTEKTLKIQKSANKFFLSFQFAFCTKIYIIACTSQNFVCCEYLFYFVVVAVFIWSRLTRWDYYMLIMHTQNVVKNLIVFFAFWIRFHNVFFYLLFEVLFFGFTFGVRAFELKRPKSRVRSFSFIHSIIIEICTSIECMQNWGKSVQ